MPKKTPTPRTPSSALANASRALRARARDYAGYVRSHNNGANNHEWIDTAEEKLEEAANHYAVCRYRCNKAPVP
jgi:hypothetical protein